MMIVDDEYIIVGSANINERSMAGDRDTEIAIGAFQPAHLASSFQSVRSSALLPRLALPKGEVSRFRLALWSEHLRQPPSSVEIPVSLFHNPGTFDCVRLVNELASRNWQQYTSRTPTEMYGHLMPYPMVVNRDGSTHPDPLCIPDTNALVTGKISGTVPNEITL